MQKWMTSKRNLVAKLLKSIPLSTNSWTNSMVLPPLTHLSILKVLTLTNLYTLIPTPYLITLSP
jgi:hypothetical protein